MITLLSRFQKYTPLWYSGNANSFQSKTYYSFLYFYSFFISYYKYY